MRTGCLIAALGLLAVPAAAADLRVTTTPSPVVLDGLPRSVEIRLQGIPGSGPLRAAVDVGRVDAIEVLPGGGARLLYVSPESKEPHTLCLLIWRQGVARVARVPLHGRVQIPVRAPRGADVTVIAGARRHGPVRATRRLMRVPAVVPPGAREARIEITDPLGVRSSRTVQLDRRPARRLALLAIGGRELRVLVATAAPRGEPPEVEVGPARLPLRRLAPGLWQARWSLPSPTPRRATVRARWPGTGAAKKATVQLDATRQPIRAGGGRRRWHGIAGLSAGLLHNTGDLLAPRLGAELGLELELPVGWIGLRGLVGVSWGSQEIAGPPAVGPARAHVLLLPLGLALTYRLPLRVLTPYVMAGLQAQLVRAEATVANLDGEQRSSDWVTSVIGLLGAERELGPGQLFLQAGFQWGRLQSPRIELLAGGVVLEAGYRFQL